MSENNKGGESQEMSFRRVFWPVVCVIVMLFSSYAYASRGIAVRPVSPSGEKVNGDQWLFVIGIDTYITWPRLKTAVNDARAFRDLLLSRYHFDKEHMIELYDEDATRKNIIAKFRDLAEKLCGEDSLVVYYAGHGHLDTITKEGSWIPVESDRKEVSAWISNHEIKNYLKIDAIKAKHVLLISDSCFSGDFFRGHRGVLPEVNDAAIRKAFKLTSRQAITSGGLEPVSDDGFGGHSVFSYFLIKALKDNSKTFLVPSDFFPAIKAGVAENAEQFPQYGSLKDTGGSQGGEFVLFLKQDSRLGDLNDATSERKAELERLNALEEADRKAKEREGAEIARREKEIAALDKQILNMKKRLGTAVARSDDSLQSMFAMVKQKEEQQRRIEEMKRAREQEEARRHAEIQRLKREKRKRLVAEVKGDIEKYEGIVLSPFGKDMKASAWNALAANYPEASEGLETGDTDGLFLRVAGLNSIGMEFVKIPAGSFMMGSQSSEPGRDSDETQHRVTLTGDYYMQATEVTQAQWKAVMGNNPSSFSDCGDDCPVENVSWNDCQEFIRRLNQREGTDKYRLPTEAEWEYAARAGSASRYCFGEDASRLGQYAWYNENAGEKIHIVASKNPNAWGLYDMYGNVLEWCEDWYGNYPSYSITNPRGPVSGSSRVKRGGCLASHPENCNSADRDFSNPAFRNNNLGFRLAMNMDMGTVMPVNGWLYVDTEPGNAAIRILNLSSDFCQGMELEAGKYNIEASAPGYEKKETEIDLAAGEDKRITVKLEKEVIPGTIHISGTPDGAEVVLNDRLAGKIPVILDGIRPGSHRVEVSAPGYKTVKQAVSLSDGEKKEVKILLDKTGPKEVGREGVYISYDNGIVVDTSRRLEWIAGKDSDTYWGEAVAWVHSQNTDGRGWRMPTLEELKGLYREGYGTRNMTPLLKTTGWVVWSGENEESACALNFYDATITGSGWFERNVAMFGRVFAVRSITEDRVSRMKRGVGFFKPASSASNEIARDGVYVAYVNGIVRDTSTGLEWIFGPDKNTKWEDAKSWVKALEIDGGGWRMPTLYEMQSIHKKGSGVRNMSTLFKTTGWYGWTGMPDDSSNAWVFDFGSGSKKSFYSEASFYARALAVRSVIKHRVASIQPSKLSTQKEKQDRGIHTDKKLSLDANSEQLAKKVTIEITGEPEGAKVFIDNRHAGAVPLKDFEVSPGSHKVTVSQEGYDDYQKTINVEDGKSVSMCIDLSPVNPPKARLYADTEPGDAAVRILNIAAKFYQGIEIEAGRYNIEASAKGYDKKEIGIDVAAGEEKRISIRLEPEKVVSTPSSERTSANSIGMKFVLIPAGSFTMGSPSNEEGRDDDETQHRVILTKSFFMGETEVTQGQWNAVMDKNPSHFSDCGEDCPVEKVSWDECQEFIKKLNEMEGTDKYRLPTEAEWEYACRAGSKGAYAGDLNEMGWYEKNSGSHTHNVKEKKPNAWGLYDMHGNVWEWCEDWDGNYLSGPVTDPARTSFGFLRILRGGSWNVDSGLCRAASRRAYLPGIWASNLGFRIVFTVE